jgi:hypothetical protein
MRFNISKFSFWFILSLLAVLSLACKNKKPVRKLIGEWEVINSTLTLKSSNTVVNYQARLGTLSLLKSKANKNDIYSNQGSWSFINFPDTIIPSSGNLIWASTDKGDYVTIPWNIHITFATEFVTGDPNRGGDYFDCYQGYLNVREVTKKNHYIIEGDIFRPMNDPTKSDYPVYNWVFELKEK